jgi:hypothetical protein
MSFQTSALIVTWAALLLLALVVSGLVRQVHALSSGGARRADRLGLRPGSPAPNVDQLGIRPPAVLLFLSEDCHTCTNVLDEAGRLDGNGLELHALYVGSVPPGSDVQPIAVHGWQAELFERYDAIVMPFAVVVGHDGRVVGSEPLGSPQALRSLLSRLRDQVGGRP